MHNKYNFISLFFSLYNFEIQWGVGVKPPITPPPLLLDTPMISIINYVLSI